MATTQDDGNSKTRKGNETTMTKTFITRIGYAVIAAVAALGFLQVVEAAGNINSINKWAWSTNAGWINFNPSNGGVTVCADHLEGFAWAENVGWIHFKGTGSIPYNVVIQLAKRFLPLVSVDTGTPPAHGLHSERHAMR